MNRITYAADGAPSRALAPLDEVKHTIVRMEPQFKAALPAHIPVEKFCRVVNTAISQNPKLVDSNRASLFTACLRAAADGLLPDGKEAALVEFGQQVVYMPMVAGILKKLRNSGELASIQAIMVHQKDKFSFNPGMDDVPNHEPDWFGDRGPAIGVYGVAKLKDGTYVVEVMSKSQIEQIRQSSRAKDSGPWKAWWDEMARKSVLRRLSKYLPQSTDKDIFEADDEIERVVPAATGVETGDGAVDITPAPKPQRRQAQRAADVVGAKADPNQRYTIEEIPEKEPDVVQPTKTAAPDDGIELGQFDRNKPAGPVVDADEVPL